MRSARSAALLIMLIATLTAVLVACGASSTSASATATTPAPTATPLPTCATALPGSGAISLPPADFVYPLTFPSGAVGTAVTKTSAGSSFFTLDVFDLCTPSSSISAVQAFYAAQLPALPHGWITTTQFPSDGGMLTTCVQTCWYDPKGGPFAYLTFDSFSDKGAGVITYRAHYAASPQIPSCDAQYSAGPPAYSFQFFVNGYTPALPLPPLSSTIPDSASGGLRGYDICSPGDTASISAFMKTELAASGWAQINGATDTHCFYTDECWKNGAAVISWSVTGFTASNWHIAWRETM